MNVLQCVLNVIYLIVFKSTAISEFSYMYDYDFCNDLLDDRVLILADQFRFSFYC